MKNLNPNIQERLLKLARRRTVPFCYSCYQEVLTNHCPKCFSDDLLVCLPGSGIEWGLTWAIEQLIKDNLTPMNVSDAFDDSVSQIFPETTTLGWMLVDTVRAMKDYDPVSWEIAQSEWLMNDESEGLITTFDNGSTYFYTSDIEQFLDETDKETEDSYDESFSGIQ